MSNQWRWVNGVLWLAAGCAVGVALNRPVRQSPLPAAHAQEVSGKPALDAAALKAELDVIQGKLPGQAHAMIDVGYHYTNLWFAGQRGNWPLAEFYFNEVRSHLRWAVRIIPVRKDSAGREIKLAEILQAVENSPLKELEASIKAKDREKFVAAYQFTLDNCYSCHKAVEKSYLTLKIPDHPAEALIDFAPPAESTEGGNLPRN
jgi:hypothetical protein